MKKLLIILLFICPKSWGQDLLMPCPAAQNWAINLATYPDGHTLKNANMYYIFAISLGVGNYNGTSNVLYAEYYLNAYSQNATYKPFWNPTLTPFTIVNGWAWNAGIGYGSASNTTGYINIGYPFTTPSSIGYFSLNNCFVGGNISGNSTAGLYSDWGVDNTGGAITLFRNNVIASTTAQSYVNVATSGSNYVVYTPAGAGFYEVGRNTSASTGDIVYYNGTAQSLTLTGTPIPTALPTLNVYLGAVNFNGSAVQNTPYIYGSFIIGLASVNTTNLYSIQQYLTW